MQKLDFQKRADIATAASRLFGTQPYHEVRLDDIAREARISKGTIYTYFKDKDDLYLSLVKEGLDELAAGLRERLASQPRPAIDAIEEVVRCMATFARGHLHVFRVLDDHAACGLPNRLSPAGQSVRELIMDLVRRGTTTGELRSIDPRLTALCIKGMVLELVRDGEASTDLIVDHIRRLLSGGLRSETELATDRG